ncbi:MAG: triose-phosphate isomerase [Thermodesulfobacteriota bacterium]|nr:triose-phosphate isomerase [Thermodesulfobacteriota bacterium]
MSDRTPLIAGNWKMNLKLDESAALVKAIGNNIRGLEGVEVLVAPPFTSLQVVKQAIGDSGIFLGAQDMYWENAGAFTGEISGEMLLEAGCTHVILGHSERRSLFNESSTIIDLKVKASVSIGLIPIICIGETLEERETGRTFEIITKQLNGSLKHFRDNKTMPSSTILAYEPVWAIGTGRTATPEQAQDVHSFIREWIKDNFDKDTANLIRILYGGSVKPENAGDLMSRPDIDGGLVGGASLKADSFIEIIRFREG